MSRRNRDSKNQDPASENEGTEEGDDETSYLDYQTILSASFSPYAFANDLVLATNNPTEVPLDLSTPLSRVLFDVQEIDTHLDKLTSSNALPLIKYTKDNVKAGERILYELEAQVGALSESYKRLEKEVIKRHSAAEEARVCAVRVWETAKLARAVNRALTLGRQLEAQLSDLDGIPSNSSTSKSTSDGTSTSETEVEKKDNHQAMPRASNTLLQLRLLFSYSSTRAGGEAEGIDDINVIRSMKHDLIDPGERHLIARAEQVVAQFSMSSLTQSNEASSSTTGRPSSRDPMNTLGPTYAQTEDTKTRATSALYTLYLLSPLPPSLLDNRNAKQPNKSGTFDTESPQAPFEPTLLISALQDYLRRAITSSLSSLTSALTTLPRLDRTLQEVSSRCQNIVALEMLLSTLAPPPHPLLESQSQSQPQTQSQNQLHPPSPSPNPTPKPQDPQNLLQPLLTSLDTSSLPSYFWRSTASQLSTRVSKILKDGGVSARTLRSNKERVRDGLRNCVLKGSQISGSSAGALGRGVRGHGHGQVRMDGGGNEKGGSGDVVTVGNWEREAAVMVGSVVNLLGR